MNYSCDCIICQKKHNPGCTDREFRDNSDILRCQLGKIEEQSNVCVCPTRINMAEKKYKNYNYNGSFHKSLKHNLRDGRLVSDNDYVKMKNSIIDNDQKLLDSVLLDPKSSLKLVNPLASWATVLVGIPQCELDVEPPAILSSNAAAADMMEIYGQAIARDVPFIKYDTDNTISKLLSVGRMNDPVLLANLKFSPSHGLPFTSKTIFRGNLAGELVGPRISQLFLLDVPIGSLIIKQLYYVQPSRKYAQQNNFRVEWGVSLNETISIQNGNIDILPPDTPKNELLKRYIYSGRSLANSVENKNAPYQLFYQAALILLQLGAQANPGFPKYQNQIGQATNFGAAFILTSIADISLYAQKNAFYWKWQHFRNLYPEVFALWINDVKNNLVPNKNNFDLTDLALNNKMLQDIYHINNATLPGANSYTLPLMLRAGSPVHPPYPSIRGEIAGACCTILKIFFKTDQPWLSLPGVINGELSGIPNAIVEANKDGTKLKKYSGNGANQYEITITDEINKLCSNAITGRDWTGLGYRSDCFAGALIGEQLAIHYMEDLLSSTVENNIQPEMSVPEIKFRRFDGTIAIIRPTICKKKLCN